MWQDIADNPILWDYGTALLNPARLVSLNRESAKTFPALAFMPKSPGGQALWAFSCRQG